MMTFDKYDVLLFRKSTLERFSSCFTLGVRIIGEPSKDFLQSQWLLKRFFKIFKLMNKTHVEHIFYQFHMDFFFNEFIHLAEHLKV